MSANKTSAKERKRKSANDQPAPKYHTKGCSRSSGDSPGARTLVFVAFEPFSSCEFRASIARTPFCAILWRSPKRAQKGAKERFHVKIANNHQQDTKEYPNQRGT